MADLSEYLTDEIAGEIAPSTGTPDPVPDGDYDLQLSSSELVQTNDKTGILLRCVFEVATGVCEGRKVFSQFNIVNKSPQAQQIGIAEFKALCLATGIPFEEARADTSVLEYKPFKAKIGLGVEMDKATGKAKVNPSTGEPYKPRNSIKKFYPHDAAAPAIQQKASAPKVAPHVAAAANAASKPAGNAKRPWEKA